MSRPRSSWPVAAFTAIFLLPFAAAIGEIDWPEISTDWLYPMGRSFYLGGASRSLTPPWSEDAVAYLAGPSGAPPAEPSDSVKTAYLTLDGDTGHANNIRYWIGRDTTPPATYGDCPPTFLGKFQIPGWGKRAMCDTRNEVHAGTRSLNNCNVESLDTLASTAGSFQWCMAEASDSQNVAWTRILFDTGGIIGEDFNNNAGSYTYDLDRYALSSNLSIIGQSARGPGIRLFHGDILNSKDSVGRTDVVVMGLGSHGRQTGLHGYGVGRAVFAFNTFSHGCGTDEMISVGTSRWDNVVHTTDMGMYWTLYGWPDTSCAGGGAWDGRLTQLGGVEVSINQTWRDSARVYAERQSYLFNWSFGLGTRSGFLSGDTVLSAVSVIWNPAGHSGTPTGFRGAGWRQIIDYMCKPGPSIEHQKNRRWTCWQWSQTWEPGASPPAYGDSTLDKMLAEGLRNYWTRGGGGGSPYDAASHTEIWAGTAADSINTFEQVGGPIMGCSQTLSDECPASGDTISFGWVVTDTLPTSYTPESDWSVDGTPLLSGGLTDAEIDSVAAWVGASWGLTCDGKIAKVIDGVRRRIPFDSLRIREYYDSLVYAHYRGISAVYPDGEHQVPDSIWPTITAGGTRCTDTDGDGLWDDYEQAITAGASSTSVNPLDTLTRYNHFAFEGQDWGYFSDYVTFWYQDQIDDEDSTQVRKNGTRIDVISTTAGLGERSYLLGYEQWEFGDSIQFVQFYSSGAACDFTSWTFNWHLKSDPAGVTGYYVYRDSAGLGTTVVLEDSTSSQTDTVISLLARGSGGNWWDDDRVFVIHHNAFGVTPDAPSDTFTVSCSGTGKK